MRRMFEGGTKARLSFSGGPHASVNMADSMENAGSWTVSGFKEAMAVPKNFKDLRRTGVRNIAQYSAANVPFPAFFQTTFTSSILSAMFTGACGPPEKLGLALVPRSYVLRMDCETRLLFLSRSSDNLNLWRAKQIHHKQGVGGWVGGALENLDFFHSCGRFPEYVQKISIPRTTYLHNGIGQTMKIEFSILFLQYLYSRTMEEVKFFQWKGAEQSTYRARYTKRRGQMERESRNGGCRWNESWPRMSGPCNTTSHPVIDVPQIG